MSLQAEYWLSNPATPSRVTGSVGLGFKAPTGSDDVQGTLFAPGGDVQLPIDESAQLGNGGWELFCAHKARREPMAPRSPTDPATTV